MACASSEGEDGDKGVHSCDGESCHATDTPAPNEAPPGFFATESGRSSVPDGFDAARRESLKRATQ